MEVTFDPKKRDLTLKERGLDFADALTVFSSETFDRKDDRFDYGEERIITVGREAAWSSSCGPSAVKPDMFYR